MQRTTATADIVASLPLQMALYFNAFYSPFWAISHICTLAFKYEVLPITYKVILVTVHIAVFTIEFVRLYLGYTGNILEKIPTLAGFWIATLILQLPLTSFLLFHAGIVILPLERAVDIIQIAFILFEIGAGYAALRRIASYQVAKFHQQVLSKETPKDTEIKYEKLD